MQDQFDVAQEFRKRIKVVEDAIETHRRKKERGARASDGSVNGIPNDDDSPSPAGRGDSIDLGLAKMRLKAEMDAAIAEERYDDAARLRDELSTLEVDSMAAAVSKAVSGIKEYQFRIGQKVVHKKLGYLGVVVGRDAVCCEGEAWVEASGAGDLAGGRGQPFYSVLPDENSWGVRRDEIVVCYVAEELLEDARESGQMEEDVMHPYAHTLFLGRDGEGNYIPRRALREKHNQERQDVYAPGEEEAAENGGGDDEGTPKLGGEGRDGDDGKD